MSTEITPTENIIIDINVNPLDDDGKRIEPTEIKKTIPRQKLRHRTKYLYHCEMCDFRTENYKVFVYHLSKKNPCVNTVTSTEIFKRQLRTFTQKYAESMEYLCVEGLPLLDKIKEYESIKLQATKIKNMTNKLPADFPQEIINQVLVLYDNILKMEDFE